MDAAQELSSLLSDQPQNPMRPHQLREQREELNRLSQIATGRDMDGQPVGWMPGDRGAAHHRMQQIQKNLAAQAPKPIAEPARRERVAKLVKDVEPFIADAMLSRHELRTGPVGAVDRLRRQEWARPVKNAILQWKRGLRALDPENDETDYTNAERLRRDRSIESFQADRLMPATFGFPEHVKERVGDIFPDPPTSALAQVRQREAKKARPQMSEAQRRIMGERMRAGRAAKAAERQGITPQGADTPDALSVRGD